jgi:DNA repair exonuclease SbcCD nuclease subunit
MRNDKIYGLFVTDLHYGASDDKKLTEELYNIFLSRAKKDKHDLDFIVVGGDIFHRKFSFNHKTARLAIDFIDDLAQLCLDNDISLRILKGTQTHDYQQLDNFKYLERKGDIKIINKVHAEEMRENFVVLHMPEEYMSDYHEYYKEYFEEVDEETKYDMIFAHCTMDFSAFTSQQQESESTLSSAPIFDSKEFAEYYHAGMMMGHIHSRKFYNDFYYPGSFSRFAYGEEKPKGFLSILYDPDSTELDVDFIENTEAPEYMTFRINEVVDLNKDIEEQVEKLESLKNKYDNVKFKLGNQTAEDASNLSIIQEKFNNQKGVKIDNSEKFEKEKEKKEEELDKYKFITDREYTLPITVQKYIEMEQNIEISEEKIVELTTPSD